MAEPAGGEEVAARLREDLRGGIGWFAFLDPSDKVIVVCARPMGVICHPAAAEKIAHFVATLRKAARRLSASYIDAIEKALVQTRRAIDGARRRCPG